MKRCSYCQNENPDGVSWCEMCGMELAPPKRATTVEPERPLAPEPAPATPHVKRRTVFEPDASPPASTGPARAEHGDYFGRPPPPRPAIDPRDPFGGAVQAPAQAQAPAPAPGPAGARPKSRTIVESSPASQPMAGKVRAALFEYRGATDVGRVHPLHTGRNTLGRDEGNSVVLTDGRVSGQHGFLFIRAEDASYMDVSSNGSVVDGRVVHGEQVVLQNHAVLKLGETTLVLVIVPESVLARQTR
ncbi:FHA domain-containing protein [Pyxidicoccus parkwayensis]|uniref:FHA domain-containing protein n=1 Tax=Pyxidicoccus parkwayensis TaxID=2813578 RepID=A0ABX7NLE7_9BACT|nr:FHA domain-containing protein [Pyxidicoccus parkwaysis]QSQ19580.1 FHA domain-containing protein [Pyxidicoccus parkwaysis]